MDAAADTSLLLVRASDGGIHRRVTPSLGSTLVAATPPATQFCEGTTRIPRSLDWALHTVLLAELGDGAHADDEGWTNQDASLPGDR